MNILVIFAHPGTDGHNTFILNEVLKRLKRRKTIKTTVLDLYKENFQPVLPAKHLYTAGNKTLPADVKKYQKMIKDADKLVFVYPVWWGSMPAILKGWFDRVLTSPFAFKYESVPVLGRPTTLPVGKLKGKDALVFNTTGANAMMDHLTLKFPSLLITKGILGFCGIRAKAFTTNDSKKVTNAKKREMRERVKKGMDWLLNN